MFCLTRSATMSPLTYGALSRGLLSSTMHADRRFSSEDMRKTSDPKFQQPHFAEYLDAATKLDAYAREHFGKRVIHLAVRWLLDQPSVGIALWGARRPDQLSPPSRSVRLVLSEHDFAAIDAILEIPFEISRSLSSWLTPVREMARSVMVDVGAKKAKSRNCDR